MRRRAPKSKEKQLELCADICIEEDLPDDPEIFVGHCPNSSSFCNLNCSWVFDLLLLIPVHLMFLFLNKFKLIFILECCIIRSFWWQNIAEMLRLNVPTAMKLAFDGLKGSGYKTRDTAISDVGEFQSVELSVLLCNDVFIRQLNKEWRDEDHATDVLSMSQHVPGLKLPIVRIALTFLIITCLPNQ